MRTRRSLKAAIVLGKIKLEHFLSENDFVEAMEDLRWRVIRALTELGPQPHARRGSRRNRPTPGYVAHLDSHLTSLATYLMNQMGPKVMQNVYGANDLPQCRQDEQEFILQFIWYELIMEQLSLLLDEDVLYYQQGWCIPQSLMDEYRQRGHRARRARWRFRNRRPHHGRTNGQRKAKATPPGTSVGWVR